MAISDIFLEVSFASEVRGAEIDDDKKVEDFFIISPQLCCCVVEENKYFLH